MIIVMMGYIRLEYHIVDVVNGHKKTSTKKEAMVLTDTNCNKCKVDDGFINKCEGSGCNKVTLA